MAHFARLDSKNKVVQVHVVDNDYIIDENGEESEQLGINFLRKIHNNNDNYVQTSYSGRIRVRYAGVGYTYNSELDAFIPPKPYNSWVLNTETANWDPPIPYPEDGKNYGWDEENINWKIIN